MLKNFVLETANAPGTATTFNLGGAASGRLSFSGAGFTNGQVVFYVMDDGTQKEWGIGTFNTGAPNTMSRTTVTGNSAGTTAKLNFTGTTNVYNGLPAENTLWIDNASKVVIPGRTDGAAAAAGKVGEYVEAIVPQSAHTVTITNASPTVITWTAHGLPDYSAVIFTTTGGLPTGLTASLPYYIKVIDANTFHIGTTIANADAGTFVNTSSAGSGTQTGTATARIIASSTITDIGALKLTAGEWDVYANANAAVDVATTITSASAWISTTSVTVPGNFGNGAYGAWVGSVLAGGPLLAGLRRSIRLSATTLVYFTGVATYTGGSGVGMGGCLAARRVQA